MPAAEHFPVHLPAKPSCQITEQWRRTEPDGSETIHYAGADGYVYEKRGSKGWFKVARA